MRKILYDLDVTTNDESINGLPILRVVATVQRYYLDGRDGETMKKAWRIPEPAIQAARQIDRRSLETMRCPEDAIKGQVDAVTSEVLQGAVRRSRAELKTYEETHYWRLRAAQEQELARVTAVPSLVARYGPSFKNLGAVPGTRCQICGGYDVMDDSGVCQNGCVSGQAEELADMKKKKKKDEASGLRAFPGAKSMFTVQGPPCPNCKGTKGWVVGHERCPDCGWDGVTCAACGGSASVAGSPLCQTCKRFHESLPPECTECGGTGLTMAGGLCPKCLDRRGVEEDLAEWADLAMAADDKEPEVGPATTIPASSIKCPDSVRIKGLRAKHPDLSKRQLEVLAAGLRKQASTCPECGGTGEIALFTSVRPCSRGCKK